MSPIEELENALALKDSLIESGHQLISDLQTKIERQRSLVTHIEGMYEEAMRENDLLRAERDTLRDSVEKYRDSIKHFEGLHNDDLKRGDQLRTENERMMEVIKHIEFSCRVLYGTKSGNCMLCESRRGHDPACPIGQAQAEIEKGKS